MKNTIKYLTVLLLVAGISVGCENFLTPSVDQNLPADGAVSNASDVQALVYGALDQLNQVALYGRDYLVTLEVEADNAFSNGNSGRFIDQDAALFTVNSGYALGVWDGFYEVIAPANIAINAEISNPDDPDMIQEYKGQSHGLRAFSHMNLLMAFGQQFTGGDLGVPYITTYNEGNFFPSRATITETMTNIEQDYQAGADMTDPAHFVPTEMNYWAIRALQTRYYLYTDQYAKVLPIAEEIINSGRFEINSPEDYLASWGNDGPPESLFELAFTTTDRLGTDNISRIYRNTNYGDVEVAEDLYNAYNEGDIRLELYSANDGTYRMVGKFPDVLGTDNVPVIRYAEVVLNYAEALAHLGRQPEALVQLTKITSNRNVAPYATGSVENVFRERRLELAMEGHRLYDLARLEMDIPVGDASSYRQEPIPYGNYLLALPIPDDEVRANSSITQNTGYSTN